MNKSARRVLDARRATTESLEPRTLLSTVSFAAQRTFAAAGAYAVATADLNGDGIPDLVVTDEATSSVSVLLGKPNGKFKPARTYSVGADPNSVAVADLTGDGNLDIITTGKLNGTVSVLMGNGDGSFDAADTFTATGIYDSNDVPLQAEDVIAANVMGDNKESLIVLAAPSGDCGNLYYPNAVVSVLPGNGDGTFAEPIITPLASTCPLSFAAGDFNGDGKLDLAIANQDYSAGGDTVTVLLGNGDGTFQTGQSYTVGNDPAAIAIADLAGNGDADIVTANSQDNSVSVLLGNGDGTFKSAETYSVGSDPTSLTLSGLSATSTIPDIITANRADNDVSVLLGNGDGTFQPQQTFPAGVDPTAVVAGDFSHDGLPDIATANNGEGDAGVLKNTSPSPFTVASGVLTITGTSGPDTITASQTDGLLTPVLNGQAGLPFSGITALSVQTGAGADSVNLTGLPIPATINAGGGNDTLIGGMSNDSIVCGAGSNYVDAGPGADTIVGGSGNDTIRGGTGPDSIVGGSGDDKIHGNGGSNTLRGGTGFDTLDGNGNGNLIFAGAGGDVIAAGPGHDTLIGSTTSGFAADTIYCGTGSDSIEASNADSILGATAADRIVRQ